MATVMEEMQISSTEPESEDGLSSQQRKILYNLMVYRSVSGRPGDLHDYDIAVGLHFHPSICGEIYASLQGLVARGLVTASNITESTDDYGDHYPVAVNAGMAYQPVGSAGIGDPILAYVLVYGSLDYVETFAPRGTLGYACTVASVVGDVPADTNALLDMIERHLADGTLQETSSPVPATRQGSHGKMYDVTETHVTLRLA